MTKHLQRVVQAKERSTTQRLGKSTEPRSAYAALTTSSSILLALPAAAGGYPVIDLIQEGFFEAPVGFHLLRVRLPVHLGTIARIRRRDVQRYRVAVRLYRQMHPQTLLVLGPILVNEL